MPEQLVIAPQSLYEFAAVASRSKAVNGLGMDAAKLARWIARLQITFDMLPETGDLVSRWASLISTFNVIGFQEKV